MHYFLFLKKIVKYSFFQEKVVHKSNCTILVRNYQYLAEIPKMFIYVDFVVFSWYFLIPILHDLLCQSNKKTISTRNLSISGVAFTMTILHSALSRLWKICNLGGIRTFHFAFSKLRLHFKIAVIIFRWCDHKYNLGHVSLLQRYNCCTIFFK